MGSDGKTTEVFTAMATETGGEARTLKSADDLLDVVCLQALDQVPPAFPSLPVFPRLPAG